MGKALALAEELGNKAGMANSLGNIGTVHRNLSDYSLALEYYGKALALHEELGNKAGVARHLGNIGNVHLYLSDYALALEYFGKALALAEELGNKEVWQLFSAISGVCIRISRTIPLPWSTMGRL
jgi:tetratricopeptide (TPR) repeat protein